VSDRPRLGSSAIYVDKSASTLCEILLSKLVTFQSPFASDVDPNLGFDGGVLEVSFDGGNTFQGILAVGGSLVVGGYNRTISTGRGSPIGGR
jgi:hypothetical protein